MFGLLKRKNPYVQNGHDVYAQIAAHIRNPVFFEKYGVPDNFDGRFDVLLVHVFFVLESVRGKADDVAVADFNQAVFDATFANIDQTLREMGIGDMGIPKHMRKMMKAFNGRMHVYHDAYVNGDLSESLIRNLYASAERSNKTKVKSFAAYFKRSMKGLSERSFDEIVAASDLFEASV